MRLWPVLTIVCAASAVYMTYHFYEEISLLRLSLEHLQNEVGGYSQLRSEKGEGAPVVNSALCEAGSIKRWSDVQSATRDTVVQIFAHGAQFNWLEPYKTPNQFQASGSGFFINERGDIITNAHVVNEAKAIFIQIPSTGKQRFEVEIIGISPERDLALLRLKADEAELLHKDLGKISFLTIGNSDQVHRADEIMALGYPLGQQSLKSTTGVVSGVEHMDGRGLIQISAPINPGSSGGPSIDCLGRVIGVNSSGITQAQNVGYIIPGNEVKLFLKQLEHLPDSGVVKFLRKPFLGVIFNNATEQLTTFLKNPPPGGLYVVEVYKGSPLQKAGVQPGDMIYEIDGHKIDLFGEMLVPWSEDRLSIIDYVSRLMLGDTINLLIYREGKPRKISLQFAHSELAPVHIVFPGYEPIDYEVLGGLVFMPLTINHLPLLLQNAPELSRFMELKNQMEPTLIVTHLFPDSVAARTRTIGPGAVIKEVNNQKVTNIADLRTALKLSEHTGFLTIKTVENVFTVLNWKQLVEQEPRLASQYFYTVSDIIKNSQQK